MWMLYTCLKKVNPSSSHPLTKSISRLIVNPIRSKSYAGIRKTKSEQVSLKNDILIAPSSQGTYTYEVIARWNEHGDGLSAFLIQVR